MIHHLKIYPEHFSAIMTGVKRAELRKNDRDFKVGDTLHLMETPKGSCSPTGEFINAVVTHIADVGEWLPGYVMLSIERESGYAAPQLPHPAVQNMHHDAKCDLFRPQVVNGVFVPRHCDCRAAMLQGADPVSQPYTLRDGWVAVPVDPTLEMRLQIHPIAEATCMDCGRSVTVDCEDNVLLSWADMLSAAPKQEEK
jgi:hypothetical protein